MAIEVLPKKQSINIILVNTILSFLMVIFAIFILTYCFMIYQEKKITTEIKNIEKGLEGTVEEEQLRQKFLSNQKKTEDFDFLLKQHKFSLNIFNFLEKIVHPNVWFSNFNLDFQNNELNLFSETDSFTSLGQQILILKKEKFIKKINLSNISITKEGKINFNLELILDPEIFSL